ncbi:MAG: glycosyltransferase [Bacteroidales bacterium]|nr:glycosyltransferase [Bacteroidales bacterium]
MKILFVSSSNSRFGISPIVGNQGKSLQKQGMEVEYFPIIGKGMLGYLRNIGLLRKYIRSNDYDLAHAHYSLSAIVASLAGCRPLVVSLMGSDTHISMFWKYVLLMFNRLYWSALIVKSPGMKQRLNLQSAHVIPNGVDFSKFRPVEKEAALKRTGFDPMKKHIIFMADPARPVKNWQLAKKAFELLDTDDVEIHPLGDVPNDDVPYYYYAADILLLTSLWEGSPNVIKEAMACNLPIVATDVGDIREVCGTTEGCFITTFDPSEISEKLKNALDFNGRTKGREHVGHLDDRIVARRIIGIYRKVLGAD